MFVDSKEIWDKKKNHVFHIYKLILLTTVRVLEAYVNYNIPCIRLSTETLLYFSPFHMFTVCQKMGNLRE